ncbi:hypothetical protein C6P40_004857 [Pichia californica]|uniref:DUF726-domain-containing protein n=1 Tax=Pichia californica TaxID=460514 RepID=A0A9P7BH46_9ASCO|nr:hypothetical protein C6P42_003133 [[Candida] californica]KAG0689554.1 hypothetical protein C6P40_004857 [[Candida] californica]
MSLLKDDSPSEEFNFNTKIVPQSGVVRDTQFIEKKLPATDIPHLKTDINLTKFNNRNLRSSFDLDDSDYEDDSFNEHGTNNDFYEYQYNQPRNSKKESIKMVDHNFAKVENDYRRKQIENEQSIQQQKEIIEQSPQKDKIKPKELAIEDDSDSDKEWKEIDTQLNCGDIYNLKGEKVDFFMHSQDDLTRENTSVPTEKPKKKKTQLQKFAKGSSIVGKKALEVTAGIKVGKSEKEEELRAKYQRAHLNNSDNPTQNYTRIDEEQQAKKFNEMDKKFDFLFQNENSNLRKLHNAQSANASVDTLPKITDDFMNTDNFEEVFGNEGHDDNELNPSIQMMSTKSMLNDSQKIAYAALVKLIIVQLTTDLIQVRGSGSSKILKKLAVCHRSFMRWSMNIMNALYEHLDIKNKEEIQMIETLSCHGVETGDLTKSFSTNLSIENHLNEDNDKDLQLINMNVSELETNNVIEVDIKWTLICDLFLILLESSVYDARSRTLLLHFADAIGISNIEIFQFERRITDSLEIDEAFEILNNNQTWDESDILKEHKKKQRNAKIVKIALATAAGGLVIGLSAGALAPVIGAGLAAGLTTIGVSGTGGFLAGAGGTAIITTSGVMSGMRAGKNAMQNRVGSVKTFEFIPLHNNRRVNLIITVSGWMSGTMDDVRLPFSTVDQVMGDLYSLLWEPEMLTSMGQTINILANEILTQSIQQILGSTLLITLMAGLQLPMMLSKLGYLLDNPWNNSLDRAWRSGKVLADTLRRNKLGVRPITLVGFSLGARLIYSCLLSLAKSGDYGIIENVYLFGSPLVINEDEVSQARSVVSGRFVNGYMKQDWILGYLFRATSGGLRTIAGISPVDSEKYNIENYNCSEFVKGHMQYREAMPKLLKMVGWEVLDDQFVEIEQPNPEEEERQRKLLSDFEKAQHSKKKKSWYNKIFGRKNKEWWEMYEEGESERKGGRKNKVKESKEGSDSDNETGTDVDTDILSDVAGGFDIEALKKEIANIEREAQNVESLKVDKSIMKSSDYIVDKEEPKIPVEPEAEKIETSTVDSKPSPDNNRIVELKKNVIETNFKLTPKTISHTARKTELQPKMLKKRPSIIQLIESSDKSSELNQGHLKSFRISSNSSKRSVSSPEGVHKVLNNVFQPISKLEPSIDINTSDISTELKHNKEEDKVTKDDAALKFDDKYNDLRSIDYGEYEVPTEEHMQIFFDDDLDAIEQKINESQKDKAGYGPVTEIDYGDEEEFPKDESNVHFSFE